MFGIIKQTSFQLIDAVTKSWSSTVGRLVTNDIIFEYIQWFSKYWTSDKSVILYFLMIQQQAEIT